MLHLFTVIPSTILIYKFHLSPNRCMQSSTFTKRSMRSTWPCQSSRAARRRRRSSPVEISPPRWRRTSRPQVAASRRPPPTTSARTSLRCSTCPSKTPTQGTEASPTRTRGPSPPGQSASSSWCTATTRDSSSRPRWPVSR